MQHVRCFSDMDVPEFPEMDVPGFPPGFGAGLPGLPAAKHRADTR